MPRMTGLEPLKIIKADNNISVIVVTTSQSQEDIYRSFALGAAAYIVKSADYREYCERIKAIGMLLDSHAAENLPQATIIPHWMVR